MGDHPANHQPVAEHRSQDGRSIRVLVAHSLAELAAKLETAGTVEP